MTGRTFDAHVVTLGDEELLFTTPARHQVLLQQAVVGTDDQERVLPVCTQSNSNVAMKIVLAYNNYKFQ